MRKVMVEEYGLKDKIPFNEPDKEKWFGPYYFHKWQGEMAILEDISTGRCYFFHVRDIKFLPEEKPDSCKYEDRLKNFRSALEFYANHHEHKCHNEDIKEEYQNRPCGCGSLAKEALLKDSGLSK